jgi:hypothetical protein
MFVNQGNICLASFLSKETDASLPNEVVPNILTNRCNNSADWLALHHCRLGGNSRELIDFKMSHRFDRR